MNINHHLTVLLGINLAFCALAAPDSPSVYRHQTKLVDGQGRPLPGTVVALYRVSDWQPGVVTTPQLLERSTADEHGTVTFTVTNQTSYTLVASKTGLSLSWASWYPQASLDESASELTLSLPVTVSGIVKDEAGKPVPDAEVWVAAASRRLKRSGGFEGWSPFYNLPGRLYMAAHTSSDGRFRIDELPPETTLDLAVSKPGLALERLSISRVAGNFKYQAGESNIVFTLKPAGSIEGIVVEEDTGVPIAGVRVFPMASGFGNSPQPSLPTGADGVFRLADLGEGEWSLRVRFGTNQFPDWVCDPLTASVLSGATNRGVKITASRGGVIEVTVRDTGGRPVKDAGMSASSENRGENAQTSDQGIARVRLTPGEYGLYVSKDGWRAFQTPITCEKGQTNRQEVTLDPAPRIAGAVLDPEGKPAPHVRVTLFPNGGGQMLTDAQGRFSLTSDANRYPGMGQVEPLLIVQDVVRNLAATFDVEDNVTNASVRLEPALTLAGRVTDVGGKAVTNAEFYLMFHTERFGSSFGPAIAAEADGRFEVKGLPSGRHYSLTVMAKGYGTENRDLGATDPNARRLDLDPFQLPGADQRLAGVVVDAEDKPVPGVNISSYGGGQPNLSGLTDSKGRFSFDQVCAGSITLSAFSGNAQGNVAAEGGDTNITLKLSPMQTERNIRAAGGASKFTGTVVDPEGKPAPKVLVSLFPYADGEKPTDNEGHFKLSWDREQFGGMPNMQRVVIARDLTRNLALALDLDEGVTNAELKLAPAWTASGRVVDTNGAAIPSAQVQPMFKTEHMTSYFGSRARVDAQGRFEIKALPVGRNFSVRLTANGFGQDTSNVDAPEGDAKRVEMEPVQLLVADQRIAGVVLDADDKPVGGAWVNSYGDKQPQLNGRTDTKGRFNFKQVCAGSIKLSINSQNGLYGNATVEGGDTNVTVHIAAHGGMREQASPPVSLQGKPLPDLAPLGLTAADAPANQRVLAVLIDAEARPSKRVLKRITDLAGTLKEKGVAIVVLHAGAMAGDAFATWKQEAALPFPVGVFKGNREKSRAAWGAAALPWLILTDTGHKVTDEGFAPGELEEKLNSEDK